MTSRQFSAEYLRSRVSYDPETGDFVWLNGRCKGKKAGYTNNKGYHAVSIERYPYEAHRLAWLYVHGEWPEFVDHIDLNRANNAIANLRLSNASLNAANIRARGSTGVKGITRLKNGRYQAQIKAKGVGHYLGVFSTMTEANTAYAAAAKKCFGEYARSA